MMDVARVQWESTHDADAEVTPEKLCRPPLHWVPTEDQLADMLTKHLRADRHS